MVFYGLLSLKLAGPLKFDPLPIYETLINSETSQKRKGYALTDTGRKILELLEEIEKVHKKGFGEDKELEDEEKDLEELSE